MSDTRRRDGTVLVIGADGLVGSALLKAFGASAVGTSRRTGSSLLQLDLAGDVSSWPIPSHVSVAFLCAGVTSLQTCRQNPVDSRRVNVMNTLALAQRFAAQGMRVVFFSTGLVFAGTREFPGESDVVNPQCEYGRQKVEAERALLALGEMVSVVRLAKVVSPELSLFQRWAEDLRASRVIHPFADYVMSPITLGCITGAMSALTKCWLPGVLHLGADAQVSYAEAANRLAAKLCVREELLQPTTSLAAGVDLETLPQHSTLGMARLRAELGLKTPSAAAALDECFAAL